MGSDRRDFDHMAVTLLFIHFVTFNFFIAYPRHGTFAR